MEVPLIWELNQRRGTFVQVFDTKDSGVGEFFKFQNNW